MHYGYRGLKIFTTLTLRFQDFQRRFLHISYPELRLKKQPLKLISFLASKDIGVTQSKESKSEADEYSQTNFV
jgi:hypothetical protein